MRFLIFIILPLFSFSQIEIKHDAFETTLPFTKDLTSNVISTETKVYQVKRRDSTLTSVVEHFFSKRQDSLYIDSLTSSDPLDINVIRSQKIYWHPVNTVDSIISYKEGKQTFKREYFYKEHLRWKTEAGSKVKTKYYDLLDSIKGTGTYKNELITFKKFSDDSLYKYRYNSNLNKTDTSIYLLNRGLTTLLTIKANYKNYYYTDTSEIVTFKNGQEDSKSVFKHDEKGNIIKHVFTFSGKVLLVTRYNFKYDDQGNWVQIIAKSKNKRMRKRNKTVTIRTIKYEK